MTASAYSVPAVYKMYATRIVHCRKTMTAIGLTEVEEQTIEEGWEGKLKGMLEILWEQGWIDEGRLQDYTINGQKDALGTTI